MAAEDTERQSASRPRGSFPKCELPLGVKPVAMGFPSMNGFGHIGLTVTDRERSAQWWEQVMGFQLIATTDHVGQGNLTRSAEETISPEEELNISLDSLMDDLGSRMFEIAGTPTAYEVQVRGVVGTHGGDWSGASVIIELLRGASDASWEALVALIVDAVRRAIQNDRRE